MFRFETPYAFSLLLLLPLLFWYRQRQQRPAMGAAGVRLTQGLPPSAATFALRALPLIYYICLALMVVALARPQWGTQRTPVETRGINIVLAVDLSESMAALDFRHDDNIIDRLQAVKTVVRDFIGRRQQDRIGMVVFGSQAYTQMPLTRDYDTLVSVLERLEIGAAGPNTAVGDAVGIAIKRLADIESRSQVIILLTDGRSNSGEMEPRTAAAIARQKGVKIYAVGVGSRGKAPFLVNDPLFGRRYVHRRVDLDAETLQQLAHDTGGLYFQAKDLDGLQKIYDTIDDLEKNEVELTRFTDYNDLYPYFLLPALALLGLWIGLKNTWLLRLP